MRTNLVGRSLVSAITHTPASGPFGPVTTPPISSEPTFGSVRAFGSAAAANSTMPAASDVRMPKRLIDMSVLSRGAGHGLHGLLVVATGDSKSQKTSFDLSFLNALSRDVHPMKPGL